MSEPRYLDPVHPDLMSVQQLETLAGEVAALKRDLDRVPFPERERRTRRIQSIRQQLRNDARVRAHRARQGWDADAATNVSGEREYVDPVPYFEDRASRRSTRTPEAVRSVSPGCGCGGGACACGTGTTPTAQPEEYMPTRAYFEEDIATNAAAAGVVTDYAGYVGLIQAACAELRAKKMA